MAQRFDLRKLSLEGDAFPVAGGVEHATPSAHALFSVSANGSVLTYQAEDRSLDQLAWYDRTGARTGAVGPPGRYSYPRLSPDGKRVALTAVDRESGNRDVWLMDVASRRPTRLTFNPANDWLPVWSPDGAFVAYASDRTAPSSIYRRAANGTGEEELLLARPEGGVFPEDWSKDGNSLLFHLNVGSSIAQWVLPITGKRIPHSFEPTASANGNHSGRYSPDGNWVAYTSSEGGTREIYVRAAKGGEKMRVSSTGGSFATWGKAGRELFFVAPGDVLMSAEVKAGKAFEVGIPKVLFRMCSGDPTHLEEFYDVAPDGTRFLVRCASSETKARSINVMTEWLSMVKEAEKQ